MKRYNWLLAAFFGSIIGPVSVAADESDKSSLTTLEILLRLYDATRGLRWTDHTNWLETDDHCSWYGITCYDGSQGVDRAGHVEGINLSDNHLVGSVPSELFYLPYLKSLTLRDNVDLSIAFDNIDNAEELRYLIVSNTHVESLDLLDGAPNIVQLHITNLQLAGEIPPQIFRLTGLKGLYANFNSFSGSISTLIGTLTDLREIYLYENALTGQLPTEIGSLTQLKVLAMAANKFAGTLPTELNLLTNLELLSLQREVGNINGPGISGPLPALEQLSQLTELHLENQLLTGPIPKHFLRYVATQETVKVDISGNQLTGAVPTGLSALSRLSLFLADNMIDDVTEELCNNIGGWMGGTVEDLGSCDVFLCPKGTFASYGRMTADESCDACSSATYYGATACSSSAADDPAVNERAVLINFYNACGGRFWKVDTDWLSPAVDICKWYGIKCENKKVTVIDLSNNDVTNTPPADLFTLPALRELILESNNIDFKFSGISKASNLVRLDLSHSDLISLTGMEDLASTNIAILKFTSNDLSGLIPTALFSLTTLTELSFSHNKFRGPMPTEIGFLTKLVKFDGYRNSITGQLPTQLGLLTALTELSIAENEFSGTLPSELNAMGALQILSIHQTTSSKSISGTLRPYKHLAKLTTLHLNSNAFIGRLAIDFLEFSQVGSERMEIQLADNMLSGTVPSTWGDRFSNLMLDVTGNNVTEISDALCGLEDWMDGAVTDYECAAILCPVGTYNEFGRQTDRRTSCRPCSGSKYMGAKSCDGEMIESSVTEVDILHELFYNTGGNSWTNNDDWIHSGHHCSWYGIECNEDGSIIAIDLSANGVTGTPPKSLFKLKNMAVLDLSGNQINFLFEGIGEATSLNSLYLSDTDLDSISGIAAATSLAILHLTDNDLTGTLPDELFELPNLKQLFLNYNRFSGRLPQDISKWSNLEELFLLHNRLTGQIPAVIGSLKKLKVLSLTDNFFTGTLPEELNDLSSIEIIAIQREGGIGSSTDPQNADGKEIQNSRDEAGIRGPLPAFDRLPKLKQLYLGVNSLTGTIPYNFLDGVADKSKQIEIDLISNSLIGKVPASLTQFENLALYLAGNQAIDGIAEGVCLQKAWLSGDVETYGCNGFLCPPNTYSRYGRHHDSNSACEACLDGYTAPFYGSFECTSSTEIDERAILVDFFLKTDGHRWAVQTNWLEPTTSICDWYGITCTSDSKESVSAILLPRNSLNGTISSTIYKLPNLVEINFSFNDASMVFTGIGNARTLEYMNVDGMGLTELQGIEEVASTLKLLKIGECDFSTFPEEVYMLTGLETLFMSENDFTGEFPTPLSKLTNLVFLACSNCGFSGVLPTSLGSLSMLQFLSLGYNRFTGTLPTELNKLSELKHLDFSDQITFGKGSTGLTGTLLDFAAISNLTELHLYHNALTGSIPSTFLENIRNTDQVNVDLRINLLRGSIPSELSTRIPDLNIYLADNEISEIPSEVCESGWNGGNASGTGCDKILCAKGSFNALGRATTMLPCSPCPSINDTIYFGSTQCGPNAEREILEAMYIDLNGRDWILRDGWEDEENSDICTWYGVTCHQTGVSAGFIQIIDLHENNMVGAVNSAIFELQHMVVLDLSKNAISLSFTGIANAGSLESLLLSHTQVASLAGVWRAPILRTLHMTANKIAGTIPEEIFKLTNLEFLFLNFNMLTGTLSTSIGLLTNLYQIYLFNNDLDGSIPTEIGLLNDLQILSLGQNGFSGSLPAELQRLTNLQLLSLQQEAGTNRDDNGDLIMTTGLTGNVLPFDTMPYLREVYLGGNDFVGPLPSSFLAGVANVSATLRIDLTANNVTGTIPSDLARFDDLRLYLAGNEITEIPFVLCEKALWMDGEVQRGCDALLCPPGTFNQFGRRVSDDDQCVLCAFNSSTQFFGSISCGESSEEDTIDERSILFSFYNALGGQNWNIKNGWEEDNLSICSWYGIFCSSENGVDTVTEIKLPSNGLSGIVPPLLFHLPNLKKLNLHDNAVDLFFEGIGLAPVLEEMLVDSTSLSTLKGIAQLENLRILHIQNNKFSGQDIPTGLFTLLKLEQLHMSNSEFSGTLPTTIGDLTSLQQFFCHKNNLSGEIPSEVGRLTKLVNLELSENNFFGTLPLALNKLSALETLFIDSFTRNGAGLTGPLLNCSGLSNLKALYLGGNTLTGSIPAGFLSGIANPEDSVTIGLKSNRLTGTVPAELGRLQKLNIELTENKIDAIDISLCSKSLWMDGAVRSFGCNGILCAPGTFNQQGRQSSADSPCIPCNDVEDEKHLGTTYCTPVQKEAERRILELIYQNTAGPKWKKNDNWMDPNVDICRWYGISCRAGNSVESLLLGSNNLAGTMPSEVFDLPNLTFLWLYSNPITFSFESIGNAKQLISILLDSTNLKTLDGIGKATALVDIDVRFNNIQGTLPSELQNLRELGAFSCSNNKLTGTIPSFSSNRLLNTLRLGENKFTGTLPTFLANPRLVSLDVSGNLLTGTIPSNFMGTADVSQKIFIDMSRNLLNGTVPSTLSRFDQATVYLRDNAITGIAPGLCEKSEWNDGDVGAYDCNGLMCAPGSYSTDIGRSTKGGSSCTACNRPTPYFGASCCGFCSSRTSAAPKNGEPLAAFLAVVINIVAIGLFS